MEREAANERQLRRRGYRRWMFADQSTVWARELPRGAIVEILADGTRLDPWKRVKT